MGWEGEKLLGKALASLASSKGTSAKRIHYVTQVALDYAKEYKRVVHAVEHFIWKNPPEYRLAGLYVMDAIIRQSVAKYGRKDPFAPRFLQHLEQTIAAIKKIPHEDQVHVKKIFGDWQTKNVFMSNDIAKFGGPEYCPSTAKTDPVKVADILSILKKRKQLSGHDDEIQPNQDDNVVERASYPRPAAAPMGLLGQPPPVNPPQYQSQQHSSTTYPPQPSRHDNDPSRRDNYGNQNMRRDYHGRYRDEGPPAVRPSSRSPPSRRPQGYQEHNESSSPRNSRLVPHQYSEYGNAPPAFSPHNEPPRRYESNPPPQRSMPQDAPRPANFGRDRDHGNRLDQRPSRFSEPHRATGDIHSSRGPTPPDDRNKKFELLRKTKMCTNFTTGTCRFGDGCHFAHHESELVRFNAHPFKGGVPVENPVPSYPAPPSHLMDNHKYGPSVNPPPQQRFPSSDPNSSYPNRNLNDHPPPPSSEWRAAGPAPTRPSEFSYDTKNPHNININTLVNPQHQHHGPSEFPYDKNPHKTTPNTNPLHQRQAPRSGTVKRDESPRQLIRTTPTVPPPSSGSQDPGLDEFGRILKQPPAPPRAVIPSGMTLVSDVASDRKEADAAIEEEDETTDAAAPPVFGLSYDDEDDSDDPIDEDHTPDKRSRH